MSKLVDLTGNRYGKLTVVSEGPRTEGGRIRRTWLCKCDCGSTITAVHDSLLRRGTKATRSCGCLRHRKGTEHPLCKHNGAYTKLYRIWEGMRKRCQNPHSGSFKNYGGRGITVCERWDKSFEAFCSDMGEPPDGMTLDRIDNDGHYAPGNCRWATRKQQANNQRTNRSITHNGKTMHLSEWATELGMAPSTLCGRLKRLSLQMAMTPLSRKAVTA